MNRQDERDTPIATTLTACNPKATHRRLVEMITDTKDQQPPLEVYCLGQNQMVRIGGGMKMVDEGFGNSTLESISYPGSLPLILANETACTSAVKLTKSRLVS